MEMQRQNCKNNLKFKTTLIMIEKKVDWLNWYTEKNITVSM